MHDRAGSMSRMYQTCYPLAVSTYVDEEQEMESVFENLEQERFNNLLNALGNTVFKQVLRRMEKILEVGEVLISPATATTILKDLILCGEREPYGVRGGTLVVLFSDRLGGVHKMGRFPLDSSVTSTYEIKLNLVEDRNIKVKLENLVRKVTGQAPLVFLGSKFQLEKKKLYRSSTSSVESY